MVGRAEEIISLHFIVWLARNSNLIRILRSKLHPMSCVIYAWSLSKAKQFEQDNMEIKFYKSILKNSINFHFYEPMKITANTIFPFKKINSKKDHILKTTNNCLCIHHPQLSIFHRSVTRIPTAK